MFAIEAVELGVKAAKFVLRFAHGPVVVCLERGDALAVRLLQVEEHHVVHLAHVAIEVGDDIISVDALVYDNQGDHGGERDDQSRLAVSDVGSLV